ncbi:hypothetical protein SDJN03_00072, partial [Cucurbita argyrosperma subsp. sororia]
MVFAHSSSSNTRQRDQLDFFFLEFCSQIIRNSSIAVSSGENSLPSATGITFSFLSTAGTGARDRKLGLGNFCSGGHYDTKQNTLRNR